jgi:glycosyltransferase involved in cell wall biosynthesis
MKEYYKPTSFGQKVFKLFQLFWYLLRIKMQPRRKPASPAHPGILMVVSKLDRIGGLELQALDLAAELIYHGFLVRIVTDRIDDSSELEFRSGFLIHRLPPSTKLLSLIVIFTSFLIRHRNSYQLIHVHGVTGFTLFAVFMGKLLGRPAVLIGTTEDDFRNILQKSGMKRSIYRKWILSAERFISISEQIRKEMIECGIPSEKILGIPNFVNVAKFRTSYESRISARKKYSIPDDQLVFLFVGRLVERKGVEFLLRAWQKCSPGILWIVGSGPEETRLKQLRQVLGLEHVMFREETSSPVEFFQLADVFVLPSLKEGFPVVVIEAMSCGLPCIATRIGGVVDQIEDGRTGKLVDPGQVQELSDAIQYVATNERERKQWGKAARETVLQRYDISQVISTYQSLYSELIRRKN